MWKFSERGASPFFQGPIGGRCVYIEQIGIGFWAIGWNSREPGILFEIEGDNPSELARFLDQMKEEQAELKQEGPPLAEPVDVDPPPKPGPTPTGMTLPLED